MSRRPRRPAGVTRAGVTRWVATRRPRRLAGVTRRVLAFAAAAAVFVGACGDGTSPSGPTPAPSVDADTLAAAFVAILADPALQTGIVQQATAISESGGDVLELRVTMVGELALPDVALEVAIETEGESTRFALVVVGDRSFVDLGEGWLEAPPGSVDTTELTDALVVVDDPDDLEYAGSQVVDGQTLHHLVAVRPLPYSPGGLPGIGDEVGTIDDLDAYVEADGTPVRIELSFTAGSADAAITVSGTTQIRFSAVGGGQVIVPPSLAPTAAPTPVP
jgi:hypothetical protein